MFDAIRSQFSPESRKRFDRSVAASAGLLFGFVVCASLAMLSGRPPFALDLPMLTLYGSALPLSVMGFMKLILGKDAPKLPVLATLWFLACFMPTLLWGELLLGRGTLHFAGLSVFLPKLIGFRVILASALAGVLFGGVAAEGGSTVSKVLAKVNPDWEARHREAIRRLAMVDVELRHQRSYEERALDEFDRRLSAAGVVAREERETEEDEEVTVLSFAEELAGVAA